MSSSSEWRSFPAHPSAGRTGADTPFFWVPTRLRRVLRPPIESSLLYLERRRGPSADYGLPGGLRRVYLYHVRKTGGSSLFGSFLALGGEDPRDVEERMGASFLRTTTSGMYVFAGNLRRSLESGRYFFGYSHIPAHELRLPPDTFTVTVLRDPVKRAISYYSYLVAGDDPTVVQRVRDDERRLSEGGFQAFLDRVPRRDLLCQLHMFSSGFSVGEAVDRLSRCSLVLATEHIDDGIAELNGRLGLRLALRRDRVTSFKAELKADELDRLRDLMEPEYQMFEQLRPNTGGAAPPRNGTSSSGVPDGGERADHAES